MSTDTIAAVATAAGQAGVGIVRVSGPAARNIGAMLSGAPLQPRRVTFRTFSSPATGEPLDSGLLLFFEGPASFTGEDVVEFQGHGGPVVLQMLLDEILASGARMARPGEFTERAFLNGKLDLAQAEAVADLIAGASVAAVRGARRSLAGEFSAAVHNIDRQVVELRMYVEAAIDFPDEDIDLLADGQVAARISTIRAELERLRAASAQGVLLREGISLALIGAPNVGKSSLLNRLAGEARAIVTDIPGTTRDLIRVDLVLDGLPVELVDTAGLREAGDAVEQEGVRRAVAAARQADVVVWVRTPDAVVRPVDVVPGDTGSTEWSFDSLLTDIEPGRLIRVLNKVDLLPVETAIAAGNDVAVSALTGAGLEALKQMIRERVGFMPTEGTFTARARHLHALDRAMQGLDRSVELSRDAVPGEIVAEELKLVHAALGEIVGQMTSDALLGEIFSRFCIGK
ncbi:MAG: tRNA uridine-5-carboxymethylaminomethyl(34) synthesis GTPase MnmE [Pseudomonadales bacterium]|nr:tRNA uridine-5-carboxymethylaminomethyl(34) synthesis GTPase MnmE [Pseudomonadales bacterium]